MGLSSFRKSFSVFVQRRVLQNGVAERMNKTVLERVTFMLSHAKHGIEFWAEVGSTACYLINHCPHTALDFKCPQKVWYSSPIDYSNLKNLMLTYMIMKENVNLELGNAYLLSIWCEKSRRVITSKDLKFDELSIFLALWIFFPLTM